MDFVGGVYQFVFGVSGKLGLTVLQRAQALRLVEEALGNVRIPVLLPACRSR